MVAAGWHAAELLAAEGIEAGLVALPWLRDVDGAWLAEVAGGAQIVTLDNHYVSGGQGDAVLAALAEEAPEAAARVHKIGVTEHPEERRQQRGAARPRARRRGDQAPGRVAPAEPGLALAAQ